MSEKEKYFQFAEQFFAKCLEISKAKNADYTGGAADPFANFKAVEILGITTEQGFLTRMMDKMKRIASFAEKGELQVKDESVTDTLRDLANYACLLAGYIESQKEQVAAGNLNSEKVILQDNLQKISGYKNAKQLCINEDCPLQYSGNCNASPMMFSLCKGRK